MPTFAVCYKNGGHQDFLTVVSSVHQRKEEVIEWKLCSHCKAKTAQCSTFVLEYSEASAHQRNDLTQENYGFLKVRQENSFFFKRS